MCLHTFGSHNGTEKEDNRITEKENRRIIGKEDTSSNGRENSRIKERKIP